MLEENSSLHKGPTERKRYEAALREEQRLRWLPSIVESSDDAIVNKNLDGIITNWSRGADRHSLATLPKRRLASQSQ
jgi:PAS domain-containing protein